MARFKKIGKTLHSFRINPRNIPGLRNFAPIEFRTSGMVTFDRSILKRNWASIQESPLKKAGLLVRRIMRGSIRRDTSKSQRPSKPGKPPKSRAPGHPFKRIFSVPNELKGNVIIGHMGFYPGSQTVMEIHEFGQRKAIMRIVPPRTRRQAGSQRQREAARKKYLQGKIPHKPVPKQLKVIKYPERKFALPALKKVKDRLPRLWKNSVRRATVKN